MTLLAAYNFDEASGSVLDRSGNGHSFTLGGNTQRTASGHTNNGANNAGGGTAATLSASPSWSQTSNRTVMLWMKDPQNTTQWALRWNVVSINSGAWGFLINGTSVDCQARNSGGFVRASATRPTDGLWHHYAATYDGTNVRMYLDGSLTSTQALTAPLRSDADTIDLLETTSTLTIVDDIRMYDTALDATAITAAMNTPVVDAGTSVSAGNAAVGWAAQGATTKVSASGGAPAIGWTARTATTKESPNVGAAAIGWAAQTPQVAESPHAGAGAIGWAGQGATVKVSPTPSAAAVGWAANNISLSTTISVQAGTAGINTSQVPGDATARVSPTVGSAAVGWTARDASTSFTAVDVTAGSAAVGWTARSATTKVSPVVGAATVAWTARQAFILGGTNGEAALASLAFAGQSAKPKLGVNAGLASIGFVANPVVSGNSQLACANLSLSIVVEGHSAVVTVGDRHSATVTPDSVDAAVEADEVLATVGVCGRS